MTTTFDRIRDLEFYELEAKAYPPDQEDVQVPSAWRVWAEAAPAELFAAFNDRCEVPVRVIRRRYPWNCGQGHPQYQQMRTEIISALDQLALLIQQEHDDA